MGEYQTKSKCERSVAEMAAAMEVANGGLIEMRAVEEEVTSSSKRRKVDDSHEAADELENLPANSASTATSTTSFEEFNDSKRRNVRSRDLKMDCGMEISTLNISQFRETSPSSDLCKVDSAVEFMESSSTTKKKLSPRNSRYSKSSKIPSAAEIEEFFSRAEKQEQKRFADKYNYDIVKDVPLEGRYQWTRLKP